MVTRIQIKFINEKAVSQLHTIVDEYSNVYKQNVKFLDIKRKEKKINHVIWSIWTYDVVIDEKTLNLGYYCLLEHVFLLDYSWWFDICI